MFFKPKWQHSDWKVRKKAVETYYTISDEQLIHIAETDIDWHVRRAAIEKICVVSVLSDIAEHDEDEDVRASATERIEQLSSNNEVHEKTDSSHNMDIKELDKNDKTNARKLFYQAAMYERNGEYTKAESIYLEIISKYPITNESKEAKLSLYELNKRKSIKTVDSPPKPTSIDIRQEQEKHAKLEKLSFILNIIGVTLITSWVFVYFEIITSENIDNYPGFIKVSILLMHKLFGSIPHLSLIIGIILFLIAAWISVSSQKNKK